MVTILQEDAEVPHWVVAPAPSVYCVAGTFQQLGQASRPNLTVLRSVVEAYVALGVVAPRFEPFEVPEP